MMFTFGKSTVSELLSRLEAREVAVGITAVRKGTTIVVEVKGGVKREPAPCDGLQVEFDDRCVFLPADAVAEALGRLAAKARRR